MADQWFILRGTARHGPVPGSRLRQLAAAGKLQPADSVWRPGLAAWVPAARVKGLFPAHARAAPPPFGRAVSAGSPLWEDGWYCARQGHRAGPCSWALLRQRAEAGKLVRSDLLWHDGMPAWVRADSLKGLFADDDSEGGLKVELDVDLDVELPPDGSGSAQTDPYALPGQAPAPPAGGGQGPPPQFPGGGADPFTGFDQVAPSPPRRRGGRGRPTGASALAALAGAGFLIAGIVAGLNHFGIIHLVDRGGKERAEGGGKAGRAGPAGAAAERPAAKQPGAGGKQGEAGGKASAAAARVHGGDWVSFQSYTVQGGKVVEQAVTSKRTVLAVETQLARVRSEINSPITGRTVFEVAWPLALMQDPAGVVKMLGTAPGAAAAGGSKGRTVGEGTETLPAPGKSLKCHWQKVVRTIEVGGTRVEMTQTVWVCPDVPPGGLVKGQTETPGNVIGEVLTGFGHGE